MGYPRKRKTWGLMVEDRRKKYDGLPMLLDPEIMSWRTMFNIRMAFPDSNPNAKRFRPDYAALALETRKGKRRAMM